MKVTSLYAKLGLNLHLGATHVHIAQDPGSDREHVKMTPNERESSTDINHICIEAIISALTEGSIMISTSPPDYVAGSNMDLIVDPSDVYMYGIYSRYLCIYLRTTRIPARGYLGTAVPGAWGYVGQRRLTAGRQTT